MTLNHHNQLTMSPDAPRSGKMARPNQPRRLVRDLFHNRLVTARTDIPKRTDIDAPIPYRQNTHVLFGQQERAVQRVPQ